AGNCRRLVWDHSAIHYGVPVDLGSKRPWAVFLGATGTYWFAETLRLCQLTSLNLAGVVEGVMRDRPAALRRWTALRAVQLSYALACRLFHYLIRVPLQTPGRVYRFKLVLRILLIAGLLRDVPLLRRMVFRLLISPSRWRPADLASVWADLQRLSALRLARQGGWFKGADFRVHALWRPHAGTAYF